MSQLELPAFLSEKEAAAYLSVSLSTIRRWRRAHTGPQFYRVGNVLRYRRDDLEAFIQQHTSLVA